MIFDHNSPEYRRKWESMGLSNRYNGAFYYSKEIVKNIIPNVKTDRNWVTLNIVGEAYDHSIIFIHNNLNPDHYDWLEAYDDLVLVCGIPETCEKVAHLGQPIYLPLSVDVKYVEQFKTPKTRKKAYIGRQYKRRGKWFDLDVEYIEGLPRELFLKCVAEYEQVYAVGRAAIEAKILGCEILPYDDRFPDPDRWVVFDNLEAARYLQMELDKIDKGGNYEN